MRIVAASVCALLLLVTSCASPSRQVIATPPVADSSVREAMWGHATEVWPQVRTRLGNPQEQFSVGADVAQVCEMGSPWPVWSIDAEALASGGSAWSSLVEDPRHRYYIPVVAGGEQVATLTTHKYDGTWRVWPHRNYAAMAGDACVLLDSYFHGDPYEWQYVESGGVWVIARRGEREAGVLVEAWGCGRGGTPPEGVLAGEALIWCLTNPDGPFQPLPRP